MTYGKVECPRYEEAMKLLKANPPKRVTTEPAPPTWGKRKGQ